MAVADHFDAVQKLYIAFYQRPADPAGLKYWATHLDAAKGDTTQIIDAFANSREAVELYGPINETTIGRVVDLIYQMLFDRTPDAQGKAFFVAEFAAGRITEGSIALAILDGAKNADQTAIANKLAVSNMFTSLVDGRPLTDPGFGEGTKFAVSYTGKEDADEARDILAKVTANPATIPDDDSLVELLLEHIADKNDPITKPADAVHVLTTGTDQIAGSIGKDTIQGVADGMTGVSNATKPMTQTFGGQDVIDGGAGVDTLTLINDVGTMNLATSVTVRSVENLVLQSWQNDVTANVQKWDGLENISVNQRGAADNIRITTNANVTAVDIKAGTGAAAHDSDGKGTGDTASSAIRIVDANTTAGGDKLAAVSVKGAKGAITIESDALSQLSLAESNTGATVVNGTSGHTLNVSLSKVTGAAPVVDATAGTVIVTAKLGASAQSLELRAAAARTIEFNAQSDLDVALGSQARNLKIMSKGTGDLDLRTTLNNDVSFTGGAGSETIRVNNASTKIVAMGAGDDVVHVSGTTLGTGGTIDGGAGTDTLAMSAADAATLSSLAQADSYEARISNFEKLSLGVVGEGESAVVNLDNLDGLDHVISAGTAPDSTTPEAQIIEFNGTGSGGATITIGGVEITLPADASAGEVAFAVFEMQEDIIAANPGIASIFLFPSGTGISITYADPEVDYDPIPVVDDDESQIIKSVADDYIPGVVGAGIGELTLANLAVDGTFELTGDNRGKINLQAKNAGDEQAAFNIKLNGTNALDAGQVKLAGIETLNIVTSDSISNGQAPSPVTNRSSIDLDAQDLTSIDVTGNHGLYLSGNLTKLTSIDTRGIVDGDAGELSGLYFVSAVVDQTVTVNTGVGYDYVDVSMVGSETDSAPAGTVGAFVSTGAGNDQIIGSQGNDTIDAGSGNDVVFASHGSDSISLGDGNDTYYLDPWLNKPLDVYDTIEDFNANPNGFDTGLTHLGAMHEGYPDADRFNGDVIDISTALRQSGQANGIKVLAADNETNALAFLQTVADLVDAEADFTGIALDASTGLVYMDFDGDGSVDSVVRLAGVTELTEAAFYTGLFADLD